MCTGNLSTTSWKVKLAGRREDRVIREKMVRKEENGVVEERAIRHNNHNAHEAWM